MTVGYPDIYNVVIEGVLVKPVANSDRANITRSVLDAARETVRSYGQGAVLAEEIRILNDDIVGNGHGGGRVVGPIKNAMDFNFLTGYIRKSLADFVIRIDLIDFFAVG